MGAHVHPVYTVYMAPSPQKTFYLETFGCQMNAHDSEKVVGTLLSEGYRQVATVEEAGLVLYNTCSIRDKAEQKVFHRLADYKKLEKQGKKFGVLGCVAQQEGEKIFERAPYVSMVCGSASYRNLPSMLVQLEAGNRRVTGLDDRETDECFETEFTSRTNPHRGYITIIEGCDKFCSYCVVPYTRGKERSRTSDSVLAEARQMADLGYTEIQLLGQNVNSYKDSAGKRELRRIAGCRGRGSAASAACALPPRTRATSAATSSKPSTPCRRFAITCICPCRADLPECWTPCSASIPATSIWSASPGFKAAKRDISLTSDIIVGFPGETEADFEETLSLLERVQYDSIFGFKYSPRPNTPSLKLEDAIPDEEKSRRLSVLQEKQREIQRLSYAKHLGDIAEVMVEGKNQARNQWIGRTSQNKVLNFTAPSDHDPAAGSYVPVRIHTTFPNSLLGEMVI